MCNSSAKSSSSDCSRVSVHIFYVVLLTANGHFKRHSLIARTLQIPTGWQRLKMYMLGAHLPDHQLIRHALTTFYGISRHTSARLCARLQLHEDTRVHALTDAQITALSAYLSSPASIPAQRPAPTSPFLGGASSSRTAASSPSPSKDGPQSDGAARDDAAAATTTTTSSSSRTTAPASQRPSAAEDPLRSMLLESDLRRLVRENIAHHRNIGTYRGRRHMQGLPVRGQRTHTNAQTAGKLNRIERRGFATMAMAGEQSASSARPSAYHPASVSVMSLVRPLVRVRFSS